jgi:uncharacterized protein YjbJ (UPF0337 family)
MIEREKLKGKAEAAAGFVKEKVGKATDNPELEAEGTEDRAEGEARAEAAREVGYAKGVVDTAVGRAKDAVGHDTMDPRLSDKGAAQALRGDIERGMNKQK